MCTGYGVRGVVNFGEDKAIFNTRRSEMDIVREILTLAQTATRKTHILYQVNLSYTQLKNYMQFLVANAFIQEVIMNDDHSPYVTYQDTDKGLLFMKDIDKVLSHF